MEYSFFQEYWWFLISVLGAALVFLLFVQGGQSMFIQKMPESQRESLVEAVEHRWELTFTTLVVFGGAFFASFPLFYSTSFGGAYWIWILILLGFVVQAVSYRYRKAEGNLIGRRAYDIFLFLNGITAPLLLGGAVSTFFFGSDFTVSKSMIAENGGAVSQWGPWHGLEVLADWRVLLFGIMVLFLARVLANLWYINQIDEEQTKAWNRRLLLVNAGVFVVAFLASVAVILTVPGYETVGAHEFKLVKYKYFHNLFGHPATLAVFLVGTAAVLYATIRSILDPAFRKGFMFAGAGTVLVVMALFWTAGYFDTPYYPSSTDVASSLTIYNSSSSEFTLKVMSIASLFLPVVIGYISWVWYKFTKKR